VNSAYIVILCTLPSETDAEKIAIHLLEKRFAACCNIIRGLKSIYRWKHKIESDDEFLLIIKSGEERYAEIEKAIIDMHPYDVPEIIALPVSSGSQPYLQWITESISG
jgi:periplasmic divalent cation tolerance protein